VSTGRRIAVTGTVQGVGFRPWVYRLARTLGVAGRVRNDAAGVVIEAFADGAVLDAFVARLGAEAPGRVREVAWQPLAEVAPGGFAIDASAVAGAVALSIPPDLTTCAACLAEVADPADRHYQYPFTSCTYCGPRFTIALDLPYDRPLTTMAGFPLCPACAGEYHDPDDRRFHAQPIACPVCGPTLALEPPGPGAPLADAAALLRGGAIVAVKGLGGFHLACRADDPVAVATLRARKHRDVKPFAVMVADLAAAQRLAVLDADDLAVLAGPERPIHAGAAPPRRRPGRRRRARHPAGRAALAVHAAPPPARRRGRRAAGPDLGQRQRRADRADRRRRPDPAGAAGRRALAPRPPDRDSVR
jgi:hydrogenase maturation protein HypF